MSEWTDMIRNRPPRLVMYCTALWGVQLVLTVTAVRLSWLENSRYLMTLEVVLLATVLLRGSVMGPEFFRALRWKPRRNPRPTAEVMAERRRIAHDLHDGIGSHLVSTMAMLDPRNPKELRTLQNLEECMLGMRLMVDSMGMSSEPLADRLAGLRHRIQLVMEHRGVCMQWNACMNDDMALPSGRTATEIFFILQEALSNVIQHSQATQVTFAMVPVPGQGVWRFEVCDNGIGLPARKDACGVGHGNGVKSMHDRAVRAGIRLYFETPVGGGNRVCVEVPFHKTSGVRLN